MASISKEPGGRRTIQFIGSDGIRRSVRLGVATDGYAETVKGHVEELVSVQRTKRALMQATREWVDDLAQRDAVLHNRLVAAKLIEKPDTSGENNTIPMLKTFLDSYVKARVDVKPGTAVFYKHTVDNLVGCFGADKPLNEITPADADDFRLYLLREKLADNTVRRRLSLARQFFRRAVRSKFIDANPFADLKGTSVRENRARMFFVTRDMAAKVLEFSPDAEWKLLFALSRYGGLRCPSEHLALKWADVDWEHARITIRSPKTEHHAGHESRQIPLFPELEPYLLAVYNPDDASEYVITKYRDPRVNLRTQLERIIRRAGLKPWPKLWQNLRSTRETELAQEWPIHVVCAWLGNSARIAQRHYLQITDADYERAAKKGTANAPGAQAVHNPVQSTSIPAGNDQEAEDETNEKRPVLPSVSCKYRSGQQLSLGDTGFEPVTLRV